MTLAAPAALWLLLGVPVLLLLEWRRRRRQTVLVSSLRLWREVGVGALTARSERRRWTLGTLCRALAIAAAASAAAGPQGRPTPSVPEVTFLLDVSASMRRTLGSGERCFDRALTAMRQAAEELPENARVTVRPVPGPPERAVTVTAGEIETAIARLEPTDLPLAWEGVVDTLLAEARGERVDVFTVSTGPERSGLRWVVVGEPVRNVAVTRLAVEPGESDLAVYARVRSFGLGPIDVEVGVVADGVETDRRALRLEETGRLVELSAPPEAERVEVFVEPGGDLLADDRAWAVRSPRRPRVRVPDRVPAEVLRALRATEAVDLERGPAEAAAAADGWVGYEPHAGYASQILLAGADGEAGRVTVPEGRLVPVDEELFGGVVSSSVEVSAVRQRAGGEVLAWVAGPTQRLPAVVREGGVIEILFDLADSTWPRDPSFPIFFANWCASLRGLAAATHRIWRTGEPWPEPFGRVLRSPAGAAEPGEAPEQVGGYLLEAAGEVWVSLLDTQTSSRGELASRPPAREPEARGAGRPRTWTRELAVLAALLLSLPWLLARWTPLER